LLLLPAWGQRPPSGGGKGTVSIPVPAAPDASAQPIFISGSVALEGGSALAEPVAIERLCNGITRREGYTDNKGKFSFQLGTTPAFQSASDNDVQTQPNALPRTSTFPSAIRRPLDLTGCEFRASHPGYQSTSVMIRTTGQAVQFYEIGTIFLKPMGSVKGSTISMTSMAAPKDASQAFEKAARAYENEKLSDAERELSKAVRIYPQYAAAWSLLGDIHQQHGQLAQAREEYMHALAADPQYVNPSFGMALVSMQEKKWQDAVQFTGQVIQLNAFAFPNAYFYNAVANYNLKKFEVAEESARRFKSLDADHRHPDVYLLLSNILQRREDYEGAAQQIREYLAAVPGSKDAERLTAQIKQLEELSIANKK
jgi:Tfp pilus assembly protein PilF